MGLYEYQKFDEETKLYLNKVMDIYSLIKDKELNIVVRDLFDARTHHFTKLDKKTISLYMAAFLVEGDLKNILMEYDDIRVQDLASFLEIDISDIHELKQEEYEGLWNKSFRLDLIDKLNTNIFFKFDKVTSELIFYSLSDEDVVKYFFKEYSIPDFYEHPSFRAVETFIKENRILEVPNINIKNRPSMRRMREALSLEETEQLEDKEEVYNDTLLTKLNDEKIWNILDNIQKKFIGQEKATEYLFYNIINNQQLSMRNDVNDGERSIIFFDGPTGTGKTAITREITEKLDIPFTSTSATNYSTTGYVGGDITDTLKELYKKANGDLEKAQRGIIVFDEFDKLANDHTMGLDMKKAVQHQLLDFMGGGKYNINIGNGFFFNEIEFDTSKLTFVCLGALSDLRTSKTTQKQSLGFGDLNIVNNNSYSITPQDLIGIGLERELVGRFNTYLHTEEYSREDLYKILKESTISPFIGFEKWITSKGKRIQIDDGVFDAIVDAAYKLNTGARSLQTIMNNIRTAFLKEVLRGNDNLIYLNTDTVIKINENSINRMGRK